jgi:hypothetical protein
MYRGSGVVEMYRCIGVLQGYRFTGAVQCYSGKSIVHVCMGTGVIQTYNMYRSSTGVQELYRYIGIQATTSVPE